MKNKRRFIAQCLLVVSFIALIYALFAMTFIPLKYRLIVLLAVVAVSMVVLLMTRKTLWRFTLAISIFIVSGGVMLSQKMLNSVANAKDYEIVEYVYIKNAEPMHKDSNRKIGFYGVRFDAMKKALNDSNPSYLENSIVQYGDAETLIYDLYNEHIDGILTQSSVLSDIIFLDETFETRTTIVDRFQMREERLSIVKDVDVMKEPFVIYLSGIDVFGDVVTRARSDLNMLIVVNPNTNKILTISIPRDSYLPLACENNAMDKLTHAGLYGVSCSVRTLEQFIGYDINYYLRLNFTGLVDIVDALDGVDVYSQYTFTTDGNLTFNEGMNHVDGNQALIFARERTNIDLGDVSRGINQQELAKAIFQKMISQDYMSRLPQMSILLQNTVDTNFQTDDVSRLIAAQIESNHQWDFTEMFLRGKGDMQPVHSLEPQYMYYVYWPDAESVTEIKDAIRDIMKPVEGDVK